MNLLSLLVAPVQAVVLFFAPHASTGKPTSMRMPARTQSSTPAQYVPAPYTNTGHALAPRDANQHATARVAAKPRHRVRVVRNVDASLPADRAGRMVVSGRFADVCAELDRLASMEMRAA
jgi:hypothetical protein